MLGRPSRARIRQCHMHMLPDRLPRQPTSRDKSKSRFVWCKVEHAAVIVDGGWIHRGQRGIQERMSGNTSSGIRARWPRMPMYQIVTRVCCRGT